ncbi:MAG: DHH family phosphoesterase, partial [Candidatus Njordarchaeales archaeon]
MSSEEAYPEGTDELFLSIKKAAKKLLNMGNKDIIFVFTHIDADGLSSGAILAYTLFKLQKPFVLVPINQIHSKTIEHIEKTYAPEEAIFLDLGSGYIGQILDSLNHLRELIILDHHIPEALKTEPPIKVYHINPWLHNIDGGKYISSSGLAYLLAISYKQRFPE